jgi:predicted dinucleotide-utilizing enzyme
LYAEKIEDQILLTKEMLLYCFDPKKVKDLEDKLMKKESEFNELKQLIKLSELLIESASDIYSDTLSRMPSLFVEDRDYLETLL